MQILEIILLTKAKLGLSLLNQTNAVKDGEDALEGEPFSPLIQRIEAPEKLKEGKEEIQMAKDLSELKARSRKSKKFSDQRHACDRL